LDKNVPQKEGYYMSPCEQVLIIEKIRTEIENIKSDLIRLDTKQNNTERAIERLEDSLDEIKKEMKYAQYWFIGILLSIIGTFLYERMF
jgi:predicted RNase H-like nuclease (RuvC/YqgF family)